jgi:ABC-type sugar transport system ATPase subunit
LFAVADRIIVLRLGERVATYDAKKTNQEEVVSAITGATSSNGNRGEAR